jgi:osmotically-inducible protein OsmY
MPRLSLATDPALNNLVDAALRRSPYFAHRAVRFETAEGRVVLRGTVGSYYHKQMAQELLRRVDGVDRIENQLEVDWS